jgi:glutaredoxin 3
MKSHDKDWSANGKRRLAFFSINITRNGLLLMLGFNALFFFLLIATSCSSENLSTGEDAKLYVQQHISGSDAMVFAKSYCPYCKATRSLLMQLQEESKTSWTLDIVDLDLMPEDDGPFLQMELLIATNQKTVPSIFIGGEHVGGNLELQALYNSGNLEKTLEAAAQQRRHKGVTW